MILRRYEPSRDREAIHRLWRELGWIAAGKEQVVDIFVENTSTWIAEVNGEAECLATTAPGTVRYLDRELPFSAVTAVGTSRLARKQGLAGRLTGLAVATDAAAGALVSGLGMFEQGFYNQLGFGTGSYEHRIAFDPAELDVRVRPRTPRRITADDWVAVHACRRARARGHGSVNLDPPEMTQGEMRRVENEFGLGYYDGPQGELTHHFWCDPRDRERGPYSVVWMAWQTVEQFHELLALIRGLGDQVRLVRMQEPAGIQMQDLIRRPFRQRVATRNSPFQQEMRSSAYWQMRICDLAGCLARTHLPAGEARFNLRLTDPITRFLDETAPWQGAAGDYVVTLGPSSGAEPGREASLPTLYASVGAFTRLWLGVRPATGLAYTDELAGPADLLERLDRVLRLPEPHPGWEF